MLSCPADRGYIGPGQRPEISTEDHVTGRPWPAKAHGGGAQGSCNGLGRVRMPLGDRVLQHSAAAVVPKADEALAGEGEKKVHKGPWNVAEEASPVEARAAGAAHL